MNHLVHVALDATATQREHLLALQRAFAEACNALAPLVAQTRCWNRVALHHLAYKQLRQRFPGLGSQMICNAIYSVSRAARLVYQHPKSPFNLAKVGDKPLPRLRFEAEAPVFFDRHTLSLKGNQVSLLTLDGRMRFDVAISAEDQQRFRTDKLREIALAQRGGRFVLSFDFTPDARDAAPAGAPRLARDLQLPQYVVVVDDAAATPAAAATPPQPAARPT